MYVCVYVCMSGLHVAKLPFLLLLWVAQPLRFLFIFNMLLPLCKKKTLELQNKITLT